MRLADFDYDLPEAAIAQVPLEPRDAARLLVDRGSVAAEHRHVADLAELLRDGDLLVVNDTRVLPARLHLSRALRGAAEVLLLEPLDSGRRTWEALVRPARKLRPGEVLFTAAGESVIEVGARTTDGDTIQVTVLGDDPRHTLTTHGEMPLPPYIFSRLDDGDRYQTVYAAEAASAAAPTAGLHFTPDLLQRIEEQGVDIATVELVVGLDTFRPVHAADPRQHPIHSERYALDADVLRRCTAARRVVAVGTTSVRALESAATTGALHGRTRLFIHRPYEWKVVDVMMTNFHMPRTTLLIMIDAFVGSRWRDLYAEALATGYRFLSFGDAMLLDRHAG